MAATERNAAIFGWRVLALTGQRGSVLLLANPC